MSEQDHNRNFLLSRKTKALCRNGHGVQPVTDAFQRLDRLLLELQCGCRREERA